MKTALIFLISAFISGCAGIRIEKPPVLSPFGDGTQWIVWEDMNFLVAFDDKTVAKIKVPRGFVSDLASTPPAAWSHYPPFGKYLTASILHDYLYWRGTCKQDKADKILYQSMRDHGVDQATQSKFHEILAKVGKSAFAQNEAERRKGLIRVIPENYLSRPELTRTSTETWDAYRAYLFESGAREAPVETDINLPKLCQALDKAISVKTDFIAVLAGQVATIFVK